MSNNQIIIESSDNLTTSVINYIIEYHPKISSCPDIIDKIYKIINCYTITLIEIQNMKEIYEWISLNISDKDINNVRSAVENVVYFNDRRHPFEQSDNKTDTLNEIKFNIIECLMIQQIHEYI